MSGRVFIAIWFPLLAIGSLLRAQDVVLVSPGKSGGQPLRKTGVITDYTGIELRLSSAAGREETIPTQRVVEIQTTWTPAHQSADALRLEGKLEEAAGAYKQAKRDEPRAWARRKIMSELVSCYAEMGKWDIAGDEWLAIVSSDSTTQFYDVMPLAWRAFPPDAALETRATAWMKGRQYSPATILGASWLLASGKRSEALVVLEGLASSTQKNGDARIAALAQIQTWRTKIVGVKLEEVQRWQSTVRQMPAEIQASGWYVVGEGFARLDQPEPAALAYLRVPLVHGSQRMMAADALVAAGKQLEKLARPQQAADLYREVSAVYSLAPAADEARSRLANLLEIK